MKALQVLSTIWGRLSNSNLFWYVVFGGFAYWGFKRLTTAPETTFLDTPIPNAGTEIPSSWKPDLLAQDFNNYFTGWFPNSDTLYNLYLRANELNDSQFIYFVKFYNAKYAKADNKTMWKRANSIWGTILFSTYADQYKPFLEKMNRLKLNY